jgi:hypothetical protein
MGIRRAFVKDRGVKNGQVVKMGKEMGEAVIAPNVDKNAAA